MDTKLLNALNNIGDALDALVEALNDKASSKSEAGAALQTGDFGKQLESISKDIKSIKADTQEILKQQKTILSTAKEKEKDSKLGIMDSLGGDDSMMKNIAKGIGVIMLLAVAVLAIGMAFKLVGKVDILSVIGLAIGITLISIAFAEVAKLNLSWKQSLSTAFALVTIAGALTVSSWIMSLIKPVGVIQFATAIFIAGTFAVLSIYLDKIFIATGLFDKLRVSKLALFLTLTSISAAITASSWIMAFIKPISVVQGLTAIMIAGVFATIGFSLHKIGVAVSLFDKLKVSPFALIKTLVAISTAIVASSWVLQLTAPLTIGQAITAILISGLFLIISFNMQKIALGVVAFKKTDVSPIDLLLVMVGIAAAITASSWVLNFVMPIGLWQFITALGVTVLFAIMSYVLPELAAGIAIVGKVLGAKNVWLIPLVMVAISAAIMLSSHILTLTAEIEWMTLLNILALGITLAAISLAMSPSMVILGKLPIKELLMGSLAMILVAGVVMVSSHILALGNYDKYPTLDWTLGVAAAMLPFGIAMSVLGGIAMSGFGALAILAGGAMILLVAATVVATSYILREGKYDTYPSLDWTLGVIAIMTPFALAAVLLGPMFIAVALGAVAIYLVAHTIVAASEILAEGTYDKYPSLDWSLGVSMALGAFALGMTTLGAIIFATFGIGGAMLAAGALAVLGVAKTIVAASDILANGYTDEDGKKIKPNYTGGPTEAWAGAVAVALGAFSPVYGMLMKNAIFSLFGGGGVGPDDFATAIKTVTMGIVTAAFLLNQGDGVWKGGPTEDWATGVSLALGAFVPVYDILLANSGWFASGVDPDDFSEAIKTISLGIVDAAKFFADPEVPDVWEGGPTEEWAKGVGGAIGAFAPVFEVLAANSGWFSSGVDVEDMNKAILTISLGIVAAAKYFARPEISELFNTEGNYPSEEWGKGVGSALNAFAPVFEALQGKSWFSKGSDVINDMTYGVRAISGSLVDSARAFAGYEFDWQTLSWKKGDDLSGAWSAYPTEEWAKGVGNSVTGFLDIFDELENRGYTTAQFSILSQVLNYGLSSMSSAARTLWRNKKYFDVELNPDFIENIARNVLGFAKLGLALDRMLVSEKIITKESSGFMGVVGASKETETVRETKDLGIVDMVVGNLVRVAKTLFFNKKYFEDTSVYDTFYKDVVSPSGIIWGFTKLGSYLSRMKTFYQGMWRVKTAAWRLVDVGEILYKGKDYFGMSIDPNYMKNVGQNILDFNEIVKQLIESEGGKGFWDKVGGMASGLLGTDPISQIARRMITLSEGYDKLANSLIKLGTAMRMLNISDVSKLGGLTRTIITGEESRDISSSFKGSSPTMQTGDTSLFENFFSKDEEDDEFVGEDPITSRLDQVIDLLTSINNNTVNINEFIELQSEGEIESPTDVGA